MKKEEILDLLRFWWKDQTKYHSKGKCRGALVTNNQYQKLRKIIRGFNGFYKKD